MDKAGQRAVQSSGPGSALSEWNSASLSTALSLTTKGVTPDTVVEGTLAWSRGSLGQSCHLKSGRAHPADLGPIAQPQGREWGPRGAQAGVRAEPLFQDAGLNGREPPEKEKGRRRLKESFENYRRWARAGGGWGCGRGPCASPRPPALSGSPAGSGPSGRCSTARGRGRRMERTPRAATTQTPRAPSQPTRPALPVAGGRRGPPGPPLRRRARAGSVCVTRTRAATLKCNLINKLPRSRSRHRRLQWSGPERPFRPRAGQHAQRVARGQRSAPPAAGGQQSTARPPAPEAGEGHFRRCPLPKWQPGGAAGGRHAAGGAEPCADTVEPRAAPRARPEVAVGARGPPAGRGNKAGLGVGLAALEL